MARYEHSGNAQDAHLVGNLTATGLGLTIDSAAGWPTAATNKFWIAIDPDTASEEHVLVNVRSGTALTIASIGDRGLEGTTAVAHTTGAVVRHIFSATEASDMALQSVANTFTAAQTFNAAVGGSGSMAMTATNHYFGPNAAGGSGARLNVNADVAQTVQLSAEASGANSNLILTTKGSGGFAYNNGGVQQLNVSGTGTIQAIGNDHYFGANALGAAGTRIRLGGSGDPNNAYVMAEGSGSDVGLVFRPKGAGNFIFGNTAGNSFMQVDAANAASGNTVLQINYHNGTANAFARVTVGAADSGGTGYRTLRVPN